MLGNKHIIEAQRILKRLEGTPVRVQREHGETVWQVTYDDDTYNNLLTVITEVANTPLREAPIPQAIIDYHREKI